MMRHVDDASSEAARMIEPVLSLEPRRYLQVAAGLFNSSFKDVTLQQENL
jgi:hypothetical protein